MEHISRVVRSVLARIANSGMIRLSAGEGCYGPATAISAQEEKGEKMPRLIDADALADELAVLLERNTKLIDEWLANLIEDAVDDAPTVDAELVRHGRWKKGKYPLYSCSECGAIYQFVGYGYNYCPECGARMDGERTEK